MAEPKDVTFELNVFGDEPKCHLKLTGPGTPPLEFVVSAFKRLDDAQKLWAETHEPPQEYDEPPYDEQETAPTEPPGERQGGTPVQPGRPRGGATEPQCKKILAICHRLDDNTVIEAIKGYAGVEWRLDKDGHCLPDWDFLRSLTVQKASTIIERLERAEA